MNRTFAAILTICVCIGLCACNGESTSSEILQTDTTPIETTTIETVEWYDLFDEFANIAAVQEYIGKKATFFGRVTNIAVDHCTMDVAHSVTKSVTAYMETKVLAKLKVGDIMVVTGIVSTAEENNYDIKEARVEDKLVSDTFIQDFIRYVFQGFPVWMLDNYNMHIIGQYVVENKEKYAFSSQAEAETYISDTWDVLRFYPYGNSTYITGVRLNAKSNSVYVKNKLQDGEFKATCFESGELSVSHIGRYIGDAGYVYKITENVCIVSCSSILTTTNDNTWCVLNRFAE